MDQRESSTRGGIASRIKGLFKPPMRRNDSQSSFNEGSSRRFEGSRRHYDGSYSGRFGDRSTGKDSSTRSIMFDLELSHRGFRVSTDISKEDIVSAAAAAEATAVGAGHGPATHRLRSLAKPLSSFEMDLLQDVQALSSSLRDANDGNVPIDELASDLAAMGYECAIQCVESHGLSDSHANYGSINRDAKCLELLRHEFILCAGMSDGSVEHSCVVDPSFRDQFSLGQQNDGYEKMLQAVPEEFVGSPIRLQALVTVICSEMVKVYRQLGVSLPPWRRPRSVLGKWFDVDAENEMSDGFGVGVGGVGGFGTDSERQGSGEGTSGRRGALQSSSEKNNGKGSLFSRVRSTFGSSGQKQPSRDEAIIVASEKSNKPRRRGMGQSVSLLAQRLASVGTIDFAEQ